MNNLWYISHPTEIRRMTNLLYHNDDPLDVALRTENIHSLSYIVGRVESTAARNNLLEKICQIVVDNQIDSWSIIAFVKFKHPPIIKSWVFEFIRLSLDEIVFGLVLTGYCFEEMDYVASIMSGSFEILLMGSVEHPIDFGGSTALTVAALAAGEHGIFRYLIYQGCAYNRTECSRVIKAQIDHLSKRITQIPEDGEISTKMEMEIEVWIWEELMKEYIL